MEPIARFTLVLSTVSGLLGASTLALSCAPAGSESTVDGGDKQSGGGAAAGGTSGLPGDGNGQPNLGSVPLPGESGCEGLECQVPTCPAGVTTSITGKVYDPAGKIPLYNVVVYVPNGPVPAFTEGASCDRCATSVMNPVTSTITDETGSFRLEGVPAGENIPLVMQVGKWRRQITVPAVAGCTDTPLTNAESTRLPRNRTEGDIPRIAIAAGGADQMECLPRRLGIDDSEFTAAGGAGRIHLYSGHKEKANNPINQIDANLPGAGPLTQATELWASSTSLMKYDIVILSCEGGAYEQTKPMSSRQALYDYASTGGRVFASHWHSIWFEQGPQPVPTTGTWSNRTDPPNEALPHPATVNQTFPKGQALAKWLVNVNASSTLGTIDVLYPRDNLQAVNQAIARDWITLENEGYPQNPTAVQYMSFNTPIGVPEEQVCGREVYTNLHVAGVDSDDPDRNTTFPLGCEERDLSDQEKVVAFMLFDLSSCIQNDDDPPKPPK
jgi:hypothetical protein